MEIEIIGKYGVVIGNSSEEGKYVGKIGKVIAVEGDNAKIALKNGNGVEHAELEPGIDFILIDEERLKQDTWKICKNYLDMSHQDFNAAKREEIRRDYRHLQSLN